MADDARPPAESKSKVGLQRLINLLFTELRAVRTDLREYKGVVEIVCKDTMDRLGGDASWINKPPKEEPMPNTASGTFDALREKIRKGIPGKPDIPSKMALLAVVDLDDKAFAECKAPDLTDLLAKWDQVVNKLAQELRHPTYKETADLLDEIDRKVGNLGSKVEPLVTAVTALTAAESPIKKLAELTTALQGLPAVVAFVQTERQQLEDQLAEQTALADRFERLLQGDETAAAV